MPTRDRRSGADASPPSAPTHVPFEEAFRVWLKIGFLSFGGPAGQIALMHRILVEEKKWISEERFLHALNYCMLLPGPEAQQLAIYVGWLLHRTPGGIVAGTLFVLPGFVVIVTLSTIYALFQNTSLLASIFFGLKAAVLAVVIEAVLRVGKRALKNGLMVALAALAFVAIFVFAVPFPMIILTAAVIGLIGARHRPELFAVTNDHGSTGGQRAADAVLETSADHTHPSLARAVKTLLIWVSLWVAPIVLVTAIFGGESVYPDIAAFFSKMAVVTFGGAYAVLAYVAQEATGTLGWLKPGEMLDGLAMAETTPGPLILVLTYVGFLAAFRTPGGIDPLAGALIGAALATWVTFVPCFLWIFLGAPYIEAIRGNKALAGALTTITAAVVGVILNLAVWFAANTLFREVNRFQAGPIDMILPSAGSFDPAAGLLAAAAMIAMLWFKLGMIPTLAASAIAGLLITSLR